MEWDRMTWEGEGAKRKENGREGEENEWERKERKGKGKEGNCVCVGESYQCYQCYYSLFTFPSIIYQCRKKGDHQLTPPLLPVGATKSPGI